ncbi:MAG: hypothetical protein M3Q32_11455 [Pseudomonadota bacterium]|nr:hypothetical protein [Pseudomonadota bacterium]
MASTIAETTNTNVLAPSIGFFGAAGALVAVKSDSGIGGGVDTETCKVGVSGRNTPPIRY